MDILTGVCLAIICVITVETILWSYTVFVHCRWSIANDVPDRRSVSYHALSLFSGLAGIFCFGAWLSFVYISTLTAFTTFTFLLIFFIILGYNVLICHVWHLVSAYINIPLEFVPYTSRALIKFTNNIFTHGYKIVSFPLPAWEEFYLKAKKHRSLIINFIDHCPDMFWTKDEYGRYTYTNEATNNELLLSTGNEVLNRTTHEVAEDLRRRGMKYTLSENCDNTDDLTKRRKRPTLTYEYGTVGDKFFAMRVIKAPIIDTDNSTVGIIGIARNITRHIETYNKIEKLFKEKKYHEAESVFLAYKQMFESMRDVRDPENMLKGLR